MAGIRLTPLDPSHLPELAPLIADPQNVRFTRIPAELPDGFIEYWYGLYENGRLDGTRDGFAIVDDDRGFLGVAREALRLLTDWAETELEMLRIELLISVGNEPSRRVAERCG